MWKDVEGFEEYFLVSRDGQLFSKRTNKILKLNKVGGGYLAHTTKIGGRSGKNYCLRIHQLVAKAFVPNPDNLPEVNHDDGDKSNNNDWNLVWMTPKQNVQHAFETGLNKPRRGTSNENAKLTSEQVKFIREKCRKNGGPYSSKQLGEMFGVHPTNISKAARGASYVA